MDDLVQHGRKLDNYHSSDLIIIFTFITELEVTFQDGNTQTHAE